MAFAGKKKEKLEMLEELYDASSSIDKPRNPIKSYFTDSKNVEKFLSVSILFIGLAAIALGFFQLRSDVGLNRFQKYLAANSAPSDQSGQPDLLGLKQKDTDHDGLNDYDELYVYSTSPYLKDSDSDGIADPEEIDSGTDPNCPKGENCFAAWSDTAAADTAAADAVSFNAVYAGNLSAAQVRELLLQSGMSQADLDAYSDEELLSAYQQVLSQNQDPGATPQTVKSVGISLNDIAKLKPDEIRQLLVDQAGISPSAISQISDEELMTFVKEVMANQSGVAKAEPAANPDISQMRNLPPGELRQLLVNAGISREVLDKTSDGDLQNLLNEILANK